MKNRKDKFISLLIYLATLTIRFFNLQGQFIYPDEITWMVRGKQLIYSLIHFNVDFFSTTAWWNAKNQVEAIGLPLSFINSLFHLTLAGQTKFSLHLFQDFIASRISVILVVSLLPVAIFLFVSKYQSRLTAFLCALIFSFNPVVIGLDRYLLNDSLLTLFSFLSITTYIRAVEKKNISLWPGIFLTLAFLTKPSGVLPVIVWGLLLIADFRGQKSWKLFISNAISCLVSLLILWPASWFHPITSIVEYFFREQKLVGAGVVTSFYLGQATTNPSWTYYLFQLWVRLPEVILIGFLAGVILFLPKAIKNKAFASLAVTIYCLLFLVSTSLSPQKLGIRYVLPIVPWVIILAVYGLSRIVTLSYGYFKVAFVGLIALGLIYPLFYGPNYYLYYNFLIGGPKGAQKYDLVGVCVGTPPAIMYLNKLNIKGTIYIAGCQDIAPYYSDAKFTKNIDEADYIILEKTYSQQFPDRKDVLKAQNSQLVASFSLYNAQLSSLYKVVK